MSLSDDLLNEIEKWKAKLDKGILTAAPIDSVGEAMLSNIKAYRQDCDHFLRKGDLVRSFECLVWAWAYLEIGQNLGHIVKKSPSA
ncbi:MAG: DUF357 domain-containing protein [Candidatus Hadarchaeales archaeon]